MMPGVDALFSNPGPLREQVSAHVQAQRWDQAWEGLQVLAVLAPLDAWGWPWASPQRRWRRRALRSR